MIRPTHKELLKKLRLVKRAILAGNLYYVEVDAIAADTLQLGCDANDIPKILLELLENASPDDYAGSRPPQRSYEDVIKGSELFAFARYSKLLGCNVYFKFALKLEKIWLISFHESRKASEDLGE